MDEIPPLTNPENMPPVRTQADLHRLWRALMGPLGFGGRSLWLLLLEEAGQPTPHLVQIEDMPASPDQHMRDNLAHFVSDLIRELGPSQMAFLLSRPGRDGITDGDRAWAECLQDVLRREALPGWPVHRANDRELVVIAPDDLAASA
jgi:hypothetical protein